VRMDSHLYPDYLVPPNYDSLLGKLIVWGEDREQVGGCRSGGGGGVFSAWKEGLFGWNDCCCVFCLSEHVDAAPATGGIMPGSNLMAESCQLPVDIELFPLPATNITSASGSHTAPLTFDTPPPSSPSSPSSSPPSSPSSSPPPPHTQPP